MLHGRCVALLVVELSRLSLVHESLGRAAADQLIAAVAARLREQLRDVLLARAGTKSARNSVPGGA